MTGDLRHAENVQLATAVLHIADDLFRLREFVVELARDLDGDALVTVALRATAATVERRMIPVAELAARRQAEVSLSMDPDDVGGCLSHMLLLAHIRLGALRTTISTQASWQKQIMTLHDQLDLMLDRELPMALPTANAIAPDVLGPPAAHSESDSATVISLSAQRSNRSK